ncbi:hypothetical protein ADL00_07705 [Streptomyces sp. AS58]|uniref:hypothetical protein n=1 Tax=Streptomyces TaxID=1883 RepID=UPI0006AF641B|nr:hypothetical protein [Streptomyces sp. AS58]KOV71441.1 hypothetical protein ADL00_07705 [Streptomyces sp. AS58]
MERLRKTSRGTGAQALRRLAPPPALTGFLLLLALVFTASYGVGSALGPVAPDMRPAGPGTGVEDEPGAGTDSDEMPGMGDH